MNFFHIGNLSNYVDNVSKFVETVILEADQQNLLWEPSNKTTIFGFRTSDIIFEAGNNCANLKNIIMTEINSYHRKFSSEDCLFIRSWPIKHSLKGWYIRLIKNGYQKAHIHPNGWVSGVVYLKTVEPGNTNEGAIELSLHGYDLPILDQNYPRNIHSPQIGDIILFPSSLFHKTIPFHNDTERCVIAFDLIPLKH
jgi:hypothetical protein